MQLVGIGPAFCNHWPDWMTSRLISRPKDGAHLAPLAEELTVIHSKTWTPEAGLVATAVVAMAGKC